jgi:hypothetical protein
MPNITRRRFSEKKDPAINHNIPKKVADYATLYAIFKGVSRASLFRELITGWYEDHIARIPQEDLIDGIADMLWRVWKTRKKHYKSFGEYLDIVEDELVRRNSRINPEYIAAIINNLHNLYAQSQ